MTTYVAAGYIAVFGGLSLYCATLILRARRAAAKVVAIEQILGGASAIHSGSGTSTASPTSSTTGSSTSSSTTSSSTTSSSTTGSSTAAEKRSAT